MPRLIHGPGDVPVKYLGINVTAADTELLAAVAGTVYCVHAFVLTTNKATPTKASFVSDGTADTELASFNIQVDAPLFGPWNPAGWFKTAAGEALDLRQTTGTDDLDGLLVYTLLTGDVT